MMDKEVNEQTYSAHSMCLKEDGFYKHLFEELPIGYAFLKILFDETGIPTDYEFIEVNAIFEKRTGFNRKDIIGEMLSEVFKHMNKSELDRVNFYAKKTLYEGKQEFEFYFGIVNKWYRVSMYSPRESYLAMYFTGITNEKKQLEELEQSRRRMKNIIEATNVGTWEKNMLTGEYFYNDRWAEILGYTLEELSPISKSTWQRLVHPDDLKKQFMIDEKMYNKEIDYYDEEYRMIHKNGRIVWIQDKGKVISWTEDGKPYIISGTHTDITSKREEQEQILYLSYCDQLTGLYNRRFFESKLIEMDLPKNLPITLIMADVNGLKLVNDSFGHNLGDELLKKASDIIKKGCRKTDIVARLGGDEFVVILTNACSMQAERIIKRINSIASKEKVGAIDISISFGYETKNSANENIQDVFKNAEDYMYRHKLYESSSIRNKTIDLIMSTLYEKSSREMQHSKRVSEICEALAEKMKFDRDKINQIKIAGLMHDIGKMGIDEKILNKTLRLSDDEQREIKRHPEIGYRILSSSNDFSEIAEYVLKHHERWDGNGYPGGFKGEEISIQSRIIAIADAYDAMTSDRPYRRGMSSEEALKELKRCSGTQFDADITEIFISMIKEAQTSKC
ncbi:MULTISPECIES: HD domain-containing phosphohydrolase [unclassified Sedimentibacter]|uniref:HD domain-containing phosphohydrolase n=1 Tax=unclassified Sedimentibacter TaxID=2649220 RepID=UPI0027DF3833|nr:HD domain-containing phosphohydrolase [Sedimentibacter sp. MB35-C1]WMJ78892.1 diguanylate cyclase [Sedimentibacter sp. MB35-C1]